MDFIYTQPNENLQLIDASLCAIPALAGPFALIVLLFGFYRLFLKTIELSQRDGLIFEIFTIHFKTRSHTLVGCCVEHGKKRMYYQQLFISS